jgi:hypothetical protein
VMYSSVFLGASPSPGPYMQTDWLRKRNIGRGATFHCLPAKIAHASGSHLTIFAFSFPSLSNWFHACNYFG